MIRRSGQVHPLIPARPAPVKDKFFFYEKSTGVSHFQVEADENGRFPVEQAAGLLAMHCMVRNQTPNDYVVMIEAEPSHLAGLAEKAQKLLDAGRAVKSHVRLTRREEEVLDGVMRSLANKEIAHSLNLSERTVKFHVSSLLAKFRVRGRMELVREAARQGAAPIPAVPTVALRESRPLVAPVVNYRRNGGSGAYVALPSRAAVQ